MRKRVVWHGAPVSLHISDGVSHLTRSINGGHNTISDPAVPNPQDLAASLPLAAKEAEHILFFADGGTLAHVAPLRISVASAVVETSAEHPTTPKTKMNADTIPAPPPTISFDTTRAVAAEAAVANAAEEHEEWTDTIDEEVIAFFSDE
ncbi:hypothetical protein JKF63_03987 [Porcisia hertigi]|uniref:Uncharacterized protein n=1 Tax=Porcisia hertigi TaxID=2761500 RepID=A0A836L3U3_9TRYP|nr:hypothetical protein JKF63_03987 [Porcisia hertigi]